MTIRTGTDRVAESHLLTWCVTDPLFDLWVYCTNLYIVSMPCTPMPMAMPIPVRRDKKERQMERYEDLDMITSFRLHDILWKAVHENTLIHYYALYRLVCIRNTG